MTEVLLLAVLGAVLLVGVLLATGGVLWLAGHGLYRRGPAPARPAGPRRPPTAPPPVVRRRHGRTCWLLRRPALVLVDPHPDVALAAIRIPPRPDHQPVWAADTETTLTMPRIEEPAA